MATMYRRAGGLVLAGLLAGCQVPANDLSVNRWIGGTTTQVTNVMPVGGFLPQPSLLQPGGNGLPALYYRNPALMPQSYQALILDPVAVWSAPGSGFAGMPPEARLAVANTFTSKLATALQAHCPMTTRPGPGVARLRFALVDAKQSDAIANTVATYAPYVGAAYSGEATLMNKGIGYFAGSATIEFYATDTNSGRLLWQAVDKRAGQTAALENTLNSQLDIDHAFDAWTQIVLERLQQFGICHS